jgi:hypothetical protein
MKLPIARVALIVAVTLVVVGVFFFLLKNKTETQKLAQKTPMRPAKTTSTTSPSPSGRTPGSTQETTQSEGQLPSPASQGISKQAPGQTGKSSAPAALPEENRCFVATFHHKDLSSHRDGEQCLQHKNWISLADRPINPKTICVKVNGTPVEFRFGDAEKSAILIGAVAGPSAEITVHYCVGKRTCPTKCEIPKDNFLSSLGGDEPANAQRHQTLKGNRGLVAEEVELDRELAQLDQDIAGDGQNLFIFKEWNRVHQEFACETAPADQRR